MRQPMVAAAALAALLLGCVATPPADEDQAKPGKPGGVDAVVVDMTPEERAAAAMTPRERRDRRASIEAKMKSDAVTLRDKRARLTHVQTSLDRNESLLRRHQQAEAAGTGLLMPSDLASLRELISKERSEVVQLEIAVSDLDSRLEIMREELAALDSVDQLKLRPRGKQPAKP